MPSIKVDYTIDNSDAVKKLEQTKQNAQQTLDAVGRSGEVIGRSLMQTQRAVSGVSEQMTEVAASSERTAQAEQHQATATRDVEQAHTSLKQRLKEITQTMAEMRVAGEQDSDTYKKLADEAGVLKDAMMDANEEIKNMASDTRGFDIALQGAQAASGAFSALVGTMDLVGLNTEGAAEAQRTLQSAIAVTTGLQSVQTAIQSQSALMTGLAAMQTKALAIAENLDSVAKGKNIIATTAATVAQKAFNLVAKANPYVLLATALVTVVGALWAFAKGSKAAAQAEAEEAKRAKQAEEAIEKQKAAMDSINSSVAAQISSYFKLRSEWQKLKSTQEKNQFIKDNKGEFNKLGAEINNVSSAENFLMNNTNNVVKAFMLRAKAAAQAAKAAELWKKYLDEGDKQKSYATYKGARAGDSYGNLSDDEKKNMRSKYGQDLYKAGVLDNGKLTKKGADFVNKGRGNAAVETQRAINEESKKTQQGLVKAAEDMAKMNAETEKQINDLFAKSGSSKSGGSGKSGGGNKTNDAAEQAQRLSDAEKKAATEAQRAIKDAEFATRQYKLDTLEESGKKAVQQIQLNYDKEVDAIRRGIADAKQANEDAAREIWETKNPKAGDKGQTWDNTGRQQYLNSGGSFDLTDQQKEMFQARAEANEANKAREIEAQKQMDDQYWIDYLKEYGTIEEQRFAINAEYNRKIAASQDEWQKKSLEQQRNADLEGVDNKAAQQKIKDISADPNFTMAMVDPANVATDGLRALNAMLNDAQDSLKDLPADQLQVIADLMSSIDEELMGRDPFATMREGAAELVTAEEEVKVAQQAVIDAQEEINNLKKKGKSGSDPEVLKATKKLEKAQNGLTNATNKQVRADKKVKKSKQQIVDTFTELGSNISNIGTQMDAFGGDAGKYLQAIGSVVSAVGAAMQVTSLSAASAIKTIESASVILVIISAVVQAATAVASLFGGKDDGDYEKAKGEYESLLNVWDTLISKKKEYLSVSWADEIKGTQEEINALYKKESDAARVLAKEVLGAGASWGSHSYGVRMNRDLKQYFGQVGISDIKDLTNMSAEQLEKVRENNQVFWAKMDDTFRDYLEKIIECKDAIDSVNKEVQEQYAQTSFDQMYDNFIDSLMDMDKSAKEFSEDLSEYFMQALLSQQIGSAYQKELETWYNEYVEAIKKGGGKLSDSQLSYYRKKYNEIVDKAIEDRNRIAKATGYDITKTEDQEATENAITNITADQADQLVGRLTAMQIAVGKSTDNSAVMSEQISTGVAHIINISSGLTTANKNLTDILYQVVQTNAHLYDIAQSTRRLYNDWDGKIDNIITTLNDKL